MLPRLNVLFFFFVDFELLSVVESQTFRASDIQKLFDFPFSLLHFFVPFNFESIVFLSVLQMITKA